MPFQRPCYESALYPGRICLSSSEPFAVLLCRRTDITFWKVKMQNVFERTDFKWPTSTDVQNSIQNPWVLWNSHDVNERLFKYCKQHVATAWSMWWRTYCRMMWSEYRCAHKFMRFDFVCACVRCFHLFHLQKNWMEVMCRDCERSNLMHPSKHTHTHRHFISLPSLCSVRHVKS